MFIPGDYPLVSSPLDSELGLSWSPPYPQCHIYEWLDAWNINYTLCSRTTGSRLRNNGFPTLQVLLSQLCDSRQITQLPGRQPQLETWALGWLSKETQGSPLHQSSEISQAGGKSWLPFQKKVDMENLILASDRRDLRSISSSFWPTLGHYLIPLNLITLWGSELSILSWLLTILNVNS